MSARQMTARTTRTAEAGFLRRISIALLVGASMVRLAIILHAGPMTDQGLYVDDAFMSHKIAQNIAEGRGITQAGQPTNGFQPLFVFLLVPIYRVLDAYDATLASAAMSATFSVLCALWIHRLLTRLFEPRVGMIGAALFICSSFMTRVSLCGLETSLANLAMLIVLEAELRARQAGSAWRVRDGAAGGALMGMAILARIDLVLLVVPAALGALRRAWIFNRFRPAIAMLIACAAVAAPWFAWSRVVCGRFTPVSGEATRTISQLYGLDGIPGPTPSYFELDRPPLSFYALHAGDALAHIAAETPLSQPFHALAPLPASWAWGWVAAWALGAVLAHRLPDPNHSDGGRLRTLLGHLPSAPVFAVLLITAYSAWCFGRWWMWRYMTPLQVLMVLPSALWVDALLVTAWRKGAAGQTFVALIALLYLVSAGTGHARLFGPPSPICNEPNMFADAMALRDLLPKGCRVGSFESGILDYYLGWDVINLDGKTHEAALRALRGGSMDELVDELRVEYVVSSPPLLRDLLDRRGRWEAGRLRVAARLRHNLVLQIMPRSTD